MNIGFIGCGNMASAIINGIVNNENEIFEINGYDCYAPALNKVAELYDVIERNSEAEVVSYSDIVFLAVKPNVLEDVLKKIDSSLDDNTVLVSICAGKSIDFIQSKLKNTAKIVRVMPNINAKVCEAISAYCSSGVSESELEEVVKLLECTGKVISLPETSFALFGVLGGCSPAFYYMFIDELARAGVKYGMKKDDALMIAAQVAYGSAKMILESEEHPYKLIDNVCSPGGTTIEGVLSLQQDGFDKAIHNAVKAAYEKDSKL